MTLRYVVGGAVIVVATLSVAYVAYAVVKTRAQGVAQLTTGVWQS